MKKYKLFFTSLILITLACQSLPVSDIPLSGKEKYFKPREKALNTIPEDLELMIEPNSDTPYGIVLDMTIADGYTETLINFSNGNSNFLYSNGDEGTIGNDYTTIEKDTKLFVVTSKRYIEYMEITSEFPLPTENYFVFYVLTTNGVYTSGYISFDEYANEKVSYDNLFFTAAPMIGEYRNYP